MNMVYVHFIRIMSTTLAHLETIIIIILPVTIEVTRVYNYICTKDHMSIVLYIYTCHSYLYYYHWQSDSMEAP